MHTSSYIGRYRLRVLLLAALFPSFAAAAEISAPQMHAEAPPQGVVAGTLTVDGQKVLLRYAYARRPRGTDTDIYVILSNLLLDEPRLAQLIGGKPGGSKKLAAVLFAIDPETPNRWQAGFVSDREIAGTGGFTQIGGDAPAIANGHVTGTISLHNQGAAHERSFLVNFDIPLDAQSDAAKCSGAARGTFSRLSGVWEIERWSAEEDVAGGGKRAVTYTGSLRIDEHFGADQLHGTLHVVVGRGIADIDEPATLTCSNDKAHLQGAVMPETPWAPDTIDLDMRADRLRGDGADASGHEQHIALKKIR